MARAITGASVTRTQPDALSGERAMWRTIVSGRPFVLALLALVLVPVAAGAGNVAAQARERGIVIVPIEPPPLTFGPGVDVGAALASHVGAGMSYSLSEATAQAGQALWVLSGIVMLVDTPRRSRVAAQQAESAEATLSARDVWVPTVVLAQEARAQLSESGLTAVRVSEQLRPLPGVENRERTVTMHNWYKPVKDWYGLDTSPFQYGEPEVQPGELVLEVGLGNYEVQADAILIIAHAKLVDPATGATLARVRSLKWPTVGKTEPLFRDDASAFKTTFASVARPAVRECLERLKLVPRR